MLKYILKRLFIFLPTLFVISLVIFMLSLYAPGDPVLAQMQSSGGSGEQSQSDKQASEESYLKARQMLSLDLPAFYFTLSTKAYPDTLYKIPKRSHQETLNRLISDYGNWTAIQAYYGSIKAIDKAIYNTPSDSLNGKALIKLKQNIEDLYINAADNKIQTAFQTLDRWANTAPSTKSILPAIATAKNNYQTVKATPTTWKNYVPSLNFYGLNNQYHKWISRFIKLDFGNSYKDKRPVSDKIAERLPWTALIAFVSISITYLMAIPLGVFSARRRGSRIDGIITTLLFMLYSLPSFWVATLAIKFICSDEYVNLFPIYGLGEVSIDGGIFETIGVRAYHLFLPIFCTTYASLAYLSRQMRGGMLGVLRQDYIRTARAKGVDEKTVIWKHTFRNSLLPIITLFAGVFPALIGGSIIIEYIFSIPGMGQLMYQAINDKDYPIVFTVVMFSAILTMIGYLVADILYAWADPRITFNK